MTVRATVFSAAGPATAPAAVRVAAAGEQFLSVPNGLRYNRKQARSNGVAGNNGNVSGGGTQARGGLTVTLQGAEDHV